MKQPLKPPWDVLGRYPVRGWRDVHYLGNRGGFSGARLWRCESAAGDFCLKSWPATTSVEHLVWVHKLLTYARTVGVSFVPEVVPTGLGGTVVEQAGHGWDLASWLPGDAGLQTHPSPAQIAAACEALGHLHHAWQRIEHRQGPCPGVQRRLHVLRVWHESLVGGFRLTSTDEDPVRPWAERAALLLQDAAPQAERQLTPWRDQVVPLHPCWCDPWRDHWLFTGAKVTGLIDYGSVKIDHAAVDLARLLGSLAGDDTGLWRIGLETYQGVRALRAQELALVPVLDRTGVVVAALNWLRWLYVEHRAYENRAGVAQRLRDIVTRLEYHRRNA